MKKNIKPYLIILFVVLVTLIFGLTVGLFEYETNNSIPKPMPESSKGDANENI